MQPTFHHCAARYLDVWLRTESRLFDSLRSPSRESLRSALTHFRVSRGFGGIAEEGTADTVISLLVRRDRYVTPKTAPKRVIDLATDLENHLGYDNLLSASSKLLWLRCRSPFVIMDKRAADALEIEGESFPRRDYASYFEAWRNRFTHHRDAIAEALTEFLDSSSSPLLRISAKRTSPNLHPSPGSPRERLISIFGWLAPPRSLRGRKRRINVLQAGYR